MRKINIQLKKSTRDALASLGGKDDTFDDIVSSLYHFRNITLIHEFCDKEESTTGLRRVCEEVFDQIGFQVIPPVLDYEVDGEYGQPEWDSHLTWACDMATDEDLVGHNRNPTLAEAVTNVYCLMNNIPAPCWSMRMKNPFARFK